VRAVDLPLASLLAFDADSFALVNGGYLTRMTGGYVVAAFGAQPLDEVDTFQ
jgi:hypothetical protein